MNEITAQDIEAGQAVYSKLTLAGYDLWVLGISNRWIWQCPTPLILEHLDRHVTGNHLDVGVGSGYYLDRCQFPTQVPRVALMDMNASSLSVSQRKIRRYNPELYRRNILKPISFNERCFDSISMNYLLHCLPGNFAYKCIAIDHLLPLLNSGGTVIGSTILSSGVPVSGAARRLMDLYCRKKVFTNGEDSLQALEQALSARLSDVAVHTQGCVALFSGRKK